MRSMLMLGVFVGVCMGFSHTAIANYFLPGRVIIGYGGGGGIIIGGGGNTTNAMNLDDCKLEHPIECECFPGVPLFDACLQSGADIQCLTPDMKYLDVKQNEPVLKAEGEPIIDSLRCTGESDQTAYVRLPLPNGGPPPPPPQP